MIISFILTVWLSDEVCCVCVCVCVCRDALDALQLRRYCCRRMILTHVDLIQKLLNYNSKFHIILYIIDDFYGHILIYYFCFVLLFFPLIQCSSAAEIKHNSG